MSKVNLSVNLYVAGYNSYEGKSVIAKFIEWFKSVFRNYSFNPQTPEEAMQMLKDVATSYRRNQSIDSRMLERVSGKAEKFIKSKQRTGADEVENTIAEKQKREQGESLSSV